MRERRTRLAVFVCTVFLTVSARADLEFSSVGIVGADSTKKFSGMRRYGMLFGYRVNSSSTRFWVPTRLDLTAGLMERGSDSAAFVSFGPSYRIPIAKSGEADWFVDLGAHPTFISDSHFNGKDLGGSFHFTSYLGLGAYLDRQRTTSVLLRYHHTSNAGLDDDNPGVDMLGLTIRYTFDGDGDILYADTSAQDE